LWWIMVTNITIGLTTIYVNNTLEQTSILKIISRGLLASCSRAKVSYRCHIGSNESYIDKIFPLWYVLGVKYKL
ncbi:MAG: hypothetical protein ACC651_13100, partial [Candidatus Scalindua sp.]